MPIEITTVKYMYSSLLNISFYSLSLPLVLRYWQKSAVIVDVMVDIEVT